MKKFVLLFSLLAIVNHVFAQEPTIDEVLWYKDSVIMTQADKIAKLDSSVAGLNLLLEQNSNEENVSYEPAVYKGPSKFNIWFVIFYVLFSAAAMFVFGYMYRIRVEKKVNK